MTYGIGIGFPAELTKEDIKKLKRELAHDVLGVVDGGKAKSKPTAKRTGGSKTKPAGKED
ncbi:hypothetical protein [Carboxydocella sp. ULO1]|uniref:hypothetical protein n=1 Tax=Carboxydocella sp. ULO1 TaxID=1926599 RepID=UPI0009ABEC9D|nr:hypothetical protein [Carboxydocella sp. ULO1]GAW29184.1 hypothetical protein ULO1_17540 [Carboxydocella sp. ULO1]